MSFTGIRENDLSPRHRMITLATLYPNGRIRIRELPHRYPGDTNPECRENWERYIYQEIMSRHPERAILLPRTPEALRSFATVRRRLARKGVKIEYVELRQQRAVYIFPTPDCQVTLSRELGSIAFEIRRGKGEGWKRYVRKVISEGFQFKRAQRVAIFSQGYRVIKEVVQEMVGRVKPVFSLASKAVWKFTAPISKLVVHYETRRMLDLWPIGGLRNGDSSK